jgi:hypothetical protein
MVSNEGDLPSPAADSGDLDARKEALLMEAHGMEGLNGVHKELYDSMSPEQRDLVQWTRTNAIYELITNHTQNVCPLQREGCDLRFKKIERRTGKAAVVGLAAFVALVAWAAGAGIMPAEAIANLLKALAL